MNLPFAGPHRLRRNRTQATPIRQPGGVRLHARAFVDGGQGRDTGSPSHAVSMTRPAGDSGCARSPARWSVCGPSSAPLADTDARRRAPDKRLWVLVGAGSRCPASWAVGCRWASSNLSAPILGINAAAPHGFSRRRIGATSVGGCAGESGAEHGVACGERRVRPECVERVPGLGRSLGGVEPAPEGQQAATAGEQPHGALVPDAQSAERRRRPLQELKRCGVVAGRLECQAAGQLRGRE